MNYVIQENSNCLKSVQFKPILLSIANESEPTLRFSNKKEIVLHFENGNVFDGMTIKNTSEVTNPVSSLNAIS